MKKFIKELHNEMVKGCYPLDPFPVYLAIIIGALCPFICYLLND